MSRPRPGDAPGTSAAMARSPLQANRADLSESLEAFLAARLRVYEDDIFRNIKRVDFPSRRREVSERRPA